MKCLRILGASGHGKVVADIAKKSGYEKIEFYDDDTGKKRCGEFPVIGKIDGICVEPDKGYFVAIGDADIREDLLTELLKKKATVVTLIHPSAVIAEGVLVGSGTVVMAGAVINSGAEIGDGCIINTCASVDHDCRIGDFCHISVGSHVAGTVEIGNGTWLGIGTSVCNNITIAEKCMVGAGAVVVKSLLTTGTYIGVPARRIDSHMSEQGMETEGGEERKCL